MGRSRAACAHRVEAGLDPSHDGDRVSAFAIPVPGADARSPEQWVRCMFEDAPRGVRWFVTSGWRLVLRLRLGPRSSPDHVAGWEIVTTAPDAIVLEARSPLLTARKVVRLEGTRIVVTTVVHPERRAGRVVWAVVAPVHHRTEPYLLERAAVASGR